MPGIRLVLFAAALLAVVDAAGDELTREVASGGLVPAWLLEVPDSVRTVLVADASSAGLLRFANSALGLSYRDRRYLSVGSRGVGKRRTGDRRTPLGVYFLTEELNTKRMDPKYGAAAFVLDYPNVWDRRRKRTGYGIWLHGVHPDTPIRPPLDTDGCLALPNDQLLALRPWLSMHQTPVIVARQIEWATPGDVADRRRELLAALDAWRVAFESRNLHEYLQLYDEAFEWRGMDKRAWARYRAGTFVEAMPHAVELDDVFLVRDPEEDNLYLARFRQTTRRATGTMSLWKRLYWRDTDAGWRIVAEDAG